MRLAVALFLVLLAGCQSISGIGGSDKFACAAPDGVLCSTVSGVYENSMRRNLPAQLAAKKPKNDRDNVQFSVTPVGLDQGTTRQTLSSGQPLRSAPRVARVWRAPYVDLDGDLHDQAYFYVTLDFGEWLIDHNRERIRRDFGPARPPVSAPAPIAPPAVISPPPEESSNGRE